VSPLAALPCIAGVPVLYLGTRWYLARAPAGYLWERAAYATLTGTVQHKHSKRDVGEIAWAIPAVQDVQNTVSIASRRRARAMGRDADAPATVSARKQG